MRRALLLGAAALLLWSGSARADLPVIDIAGYTISLEHLRQALKQVQDAETMVTQGVTQIGHLKSIVDAAAHGDVLALAQLGPELSSLGIGDLVSPGAGAAQLMDSVAGVALAAGRLSTVANRVMQQDAFYLPPSGSWSADRVIAAARMAAGQKALGQSSFDDSAAQIRGLEAVRTKAAGAGDILAAQQATAAIAAIQAKVGLQGNQLVAARIMQDGQAATLTAQQQQISRCAWERLGANAKAAQAAADAGQIQLVTDVSVPCSGSSTTSAAVADADTPGTLTDGATPVPIADGLDQYLGQSVGSGQCVALVQAADPSVGLTRTWAQGAQVQGNTDIQPGTPIATFSEGGQYTNSTDGSSHAAIYLGQNATGIQVEDQWLGQPAHVRTIPFNSGGTAANNGSQFYVISHAST